MEMMVRIQCGSGYQLIRGKTAFGPCRHDDDGGGDDDDGWSA